jgi:hypothetical protein
MKFRTFTVDVPEAAVPKFLISLAKIYENSELLSAESQEATHDFASWKKGDEPLLRTLFAEITKPLSKQIYEILSQFPNQKFSTGELAAKTGNSRREVAGALSQPAKAAKTLGRAKLHITDARTKEIWLTTETSELIQQVLKA